MTLTSVFEKVGHWYATRPTHSKVLLAIATTMLVVELLLRNLAPKSAIYTAWTRFFLGLGKLWTVVLLSLLYAVAIGPMAVIMRLMRNDPLDRTLAAAPSFWHAHEPNPMGPRAAARYQF